MAVAVAHGRAADKHLQVIRIKPPGMGAFLCILLLDVLMRCKSSYHIVSGTPPSLAGGGA